MTYQRALYFAVSKCRELIRAGRSPGAASKIAVAEFGLPVEDRAEVSRLARIAEIGCIDARRFFTDERNQTS